MNAFAIDVTLPDGSVEKRFKYEHYPKSNGVYRVEAQAFDALDDAAPGDAPYLVDPTPATRRYVVGAVVASEGALDRKTGVLTFDFDRDVRSDSERSRTPGHPDHPSSNAQRRSSPPTLASWAL